MCGSDVLKLTNMEYYAGFKEIVIVIGGSTILVNIATAFASSQMICATSARPINPLQEQCTHTTQFMNMSQTSGNCKEPAYTTV